MQRAYRAIPEGIRWIISVNTVVFLIQVLLPREWNDLIISYFGLSADAVTNLIQPWRLITYQFFHAHVFHILFNMLWLWWMGRPVEDSLGSQRLLMLFVGSGVGGGLIHTLAAAMFGGGLTIGASGSVFGVMVAFAMLFPTMPIMLFLLPPLEARFVVAGLILIDLLFIGTNDNAARIVHLGGAFSGWLLFKNVIYGNAFNNPFQNLWSRARESSHRAKSRASMKIVEDAQVIEEVDQSMLDTILDKIAKKGYDGLTQEEKRVLFELSKKN